VLLEREVEEKLVLIDAGSSFCADFGSMLGLRGAGCARMGCVGNGVNLVHLCSHPRRYVHIY
jgi:hypothetical protein